MTSPAQREAGKQSTLRLGGPTSHIFRRDSKSRKLLLCKYTNEPSGRHTYWTLFIRCLRDNISSSHGQKSFRDISESRPHIAASAAAAANLAHRVQGVYTAAQGINLIQDLWKSVSTIVSVQPSIVLMHVGSNDMAQLAQSDPQRAESLALLVVEFARTLVRDHGVKIVILNSMVPRDSTNTRCCAKIFELNMNLFNATLLRESEHDACMLVLQPHARVLQAKGEQQRCPPPSVQLV